MPGMRRQWPRRRRTSREHAMNMSEHDMVAKLVETIERNARAAAAKAEAERQPLAWVKLERYVEISGDSVDSVQARRKAGKSPACPLPPQAGQSSSPLPGSAPLFKKTRPPGVAAMVWPAARAAAMACCASGESGARRRWAAWSS